MQCVLLLDAFVKVFGRIILLLRYVMNLRLVAKLQPLPNRHLCGRAVMIIVLVVIFCEFLLQCKQCQCLKSCR